MNTLEKNSLIFISTWLLFTLVILTIYTWLIKHNAKFRNSRIIKINRKYDDILVITFGFIFTSPILVYFVIFLIQHYFRNNIVIIGNSTSWIGFTGSLMGGTLTMLALLFTIKYEDSIRKNNEKIRSEERLEDKILEIMPYPIISPKIFDSGGESIDKVIDNRKSNLRFALSNYSENLLIIDSLFSELTELQCTSGEKLEKFSLHHSIPLLISREIIPQNMPKSLTVSVFDILDNEVYESYQNMFLNRNYSTIKCTLIFTLFFSDVLNLQHYVYYHLCDVTYVLNTGANKTQVIDKVIYGDVSINVEFKRISNQKLMLLKEKLQRNDNSNFPKI